MTPPVPVARAATVVAGGGVAESARYSREQDYGPRRVFLVEGCRAGAGRRAGWATGCRGRSVHWQQCGASGAPVVPVKMNTYVSDKIHCTFIQRRVPVLCSVWGGGKGDSEKRMLWFLIALLQLKGWCAQAGGGHTSRRHIITIYIYI